MGISQISVRDTATGIEWRSYGDSRALLQFHAALHNRHNKRVNIVWGPTDSLGEGYPTSLWPNTLEGHLAYLLKKRFPTINASTGSDVSYGMGRGFVGIPGNAIQTGPPAGGPFGWTFTAGTHDETSGYGTKYPVQFMSVTGAKALLTLPPGAGPLTSFDIKHIAGASGSATGGYWMPDASGVKTAFTTLAGADTATTLHVASAVNTSLEIGWNAGNGVLLDGIVEYTGNENSGIAVHNCGLGGAQVSTWLTHHSPAGWPQGMAALSPDLCLLQLGGNEYLHNVAAATFQTNLVSLIAIMRAAGITCPIVLVMTYSAPPLSGTPLLQDYVSAARTVAKADPTLRVVEIAPRLPATNDVSTFGLFHTDNIHGNANGNAYHLIADVVFESITPQAA